MAGELDIRRREVIHYLGGAGKKIPPELDALIDEVIEEAKALVRPATVFREVPVLKTPPSAGGVPLLGRDINAHLCGCETAFLLAATVGLSVSRRLEFLMKTDMQRAVILDAAATAAVESLCDWALREMEKTRPHLTTRFSCGYGDFPVSVQTSFVSALDTHRRIGLSVTKSMMLVPQKSVTAVIGVLPGPRAKENTKRCASCALRESCAFADMTEKTQQAFGK